jgi:hypothetical protein
MADGEYVAHFRVSTVRQGQSGLGLEGQQQTVLTWLNGGNWNLIATFTVIESGTDDTNRPELAKRCGRAASTRRLWLLADWIALAVTRRGCLDWKSKATTLSSPPTHHHPPSIGILAVIAEEKHG